MSDVHGRKAEMGLIFFKICKGSRFLGAGSFFQVLSFLICSAKVPYTGQPASSPPSTAPLCYMVQCAKKSTVEVKFLYIVGMYRFVPPGEENKPGKPSLCNML